ncbi:MAG: pyridoxal-phosphate dependent enzyme, partial [Candidatus Micrarchaeota archaeon]|nr:pyridoxal-phosphate dependent enzyme [Candidatus Micrarchaeota archaeon]
MECQRPIFVDAPLYRCPGCGGSLEVTYDYAKMRASFISAQFRFVCPSHMKYHFALPLKEPHNAITMSEGGTPLICISEGLYAKFEGVNPTGSFKDRGSSVEISKACELGIDHVACASTGNMGASVAAYAARAGVRAT